MRAAQRWPRVGATLNEPGVPMASTPHATQDDLPFDDGAAPTPAEEESFTEVENDLARLVQAKYAPRISRAFGAAMLDADNLRPPIPRAPRSRGGRGRVAAVAIAICLGACAIWAWRSHGGPAEDIVATADTPSGAISADAAAEQIARTPDPEPAQAAAPPQVETSAPPPPQAAAQGGRQAAPPARSLAPPAAPAAAAPRAAPAERAQDQTSELAALRETVAALAAGQRKLTVDIARLQAQKPDRPPAEAPHRPVLRRVSARPAPHATAPAHRPAPIAPIRPQATRQAAMANPVSAPPRPALQIPAGPQPANVPLRPPMAVPQP